MESVVFFSDNLEKKPIIKVSQDFEFNNIKLKTGIIEEEDIMLENNNNNSNKVLVKKLAFSCNYRDKSLLSYISNKIFDGKSNGELYYSHIGSEFVGEIIAKGKRVCGLEIGDWVIPNIAYPSFDKSYIPGLPTNGASKRMEIFSENKLLKVPKTYPIEVLAAFPIAGFTAYSMIRKVIEPHMNVLVTAARSSTSLAVISALSELPVNIYAMTTDYTCINILKQMGVKDVIIVDLKKEMLDKEVIKKIFEIGCFDAVIDPFFDIYFSRIIGFLKMNSKYITCGLFNQFSDTSHTSLREIKMRDIFIHLMKNNISLIGNCIGEVQDGNTALKNLEIGKFTVKIDHVYHYGEEKAFFNRSFTDSTKLGKVVYKY